MLFALTAQLSLTLKLRSDLCGQIPMAQECRQFIRRNETSLPLTGLNTYV